MTRDYAEYECNCAVFFGGGAPLLCPVHEKPQREPQKRETVPTLPEFFAHLTDAQKMNFIAELYAVMSPEFKKQLLQALIPAGPGDAVDVKITSNNDMVRIDFAHPLNWMVLSREHALQLGFTLMSHAGADFQKVAGG